ncbi:hypothetical protein K1719_031628 [Acacia pycnantha]|nr:hypothetical protein K1719_031628 [Acacia pycnantha]
MSSSSSSERDKRILEDMRELCGYVCVNLLEEDWDPLYSLVAVFDEIIPQLLREPDPEHPNNHDAAALMRDENKEKFEQRVRGEETVVYELHFMAFQQQKRSLFPLTN